MLESVSLQNFRNHAEREVLFDAQTVIIGSNGSGKTSVLEAVAMLSVTTSWRTERDSEVVAWEQSFARITGGLHELVVQRSPYYKRLRVDSVSKKVGEVVGLMPTILFQPDDSQLVSGSPGYRRASLDRLLSQTKPGYMTALSRLTRVLKQRNKLLKQVQEGQASSSELDYWDEELARETSLIREARTELVPLLEAATARIFAELVPDGLPVSFHYHESPRGQVSEEHVLQHLRDNRMKEVGSGMTLYGPQREDIEFLWGGHPASETMSRGQVRALALSFKLAELEYVETATETQPILLLDDIFSEFDEERRKRVMDLTLKYQSILTATEFETKMCPGARVVSL